MLLFCKGQGDALPCFVYERLEDLDSGNVDSQSKVLAEEVIRDCAGVMFGAGSDSVRTNQIS
jgi:hypothetical protein